MGILEILGIVASVMTIVSFCYNVAKAIKKRNKKDRHDSGKV